MKKILYALICTILVTVACGTSSIAPTLDPNTIQTVIINTALAAQNQTQVAGGVSASTPIPVNTQLPTNTPLPTNLPLPTLTSTLVPLPTTYQGNGDGIADLPKDSFGVLHIVGNTSSGYFGVNGFDSNNNKKDLLVNTTDSYDGRIPLNYFVGSDGITRLQITGQGPWTVTYYPFASYDHSTSNLNITGTNDDVWIFSQNIIPDRIEITGNQTSRYFGVVILGSNKNVLAVNTTDPYNGTFLYPSELGIITGVVITAVGNWQINIIPK